MAAFRSAASFGAGGIGITFRGAFSFAGTHFTITEHDGQPKPMQRPHPPLLIGGNSRRAIRRAVELGDAWNPFFTPAALSATARTAPMGGEADLAEGIAYLRAHCETVGRATPPEVVLGGLNPPGEAWTPDALLERIARYEALGVTAAAAHIEGRTRAEWCDNAERFAAEILARLDRKELTDSPVEA